MSHYFSSSLSPYAIAFVFLLTSKACFGTTFTLINRCTYTVWPGILSNSGSSDFGTTGFELRPHADRAFKAQPGWSGRFWARTGCSFDPTTGHGRCDTGDCNSGQVECSGAGAEPPATLVEFSIGPSSGSPDFYDVSLVDGYNVPVVVEPGGGSGACGLTGCPADLNRMCPSELRAGGGQRGCMSACGKFGSPEYCCSGAHGSPDTCRPSAYSEMFKSVCPRAYSYAYDDASSTFTCSGADYTIVFCPSVMSQKSSTDTSSSSSSSASASPSESSNAEDDFLSWLPDFGSGTSSNHAVLRSSCIIMCLTTIFLNFSYELIFSTV